MFRTEFTIAPSSSKISLSSSILTMGSCFADSIGNYLVNNKLHALINPFGTLFNPVSISKTLTTALQKEKPFAPFYLQNQELCWHYDYHSSLVAEQPEQLAQYIEEQNEQVRKQLNTNGQSPDFLIITLGSAFAYQHIEQREYVANCHKMPAALFQKELLSVKHICQNMGQLFRLLRKHHENLHIILTVSPVRHLKDGIPENQVSKAILRAVCHYLVADYEGVSYFPSYELMMDDLRDYRFYTADMIHPNETAIAYILEKFSQTYFDVPLRQFIAQWQTIQKALNHRPFNEKSVAHQQFLQKLRADLQALSSQISVTEELAMVESRLTAL